jgi:hypothetical protein
MKVVKTVKIPSKKINGKMFHLLDTAQSNTAAENKAQVLAGTGRFTEIAIKEFTEKGIKRVGIWGRVPTDK